MAQVTLDCIGLPCPQPVVRTKEALDQGATLVEVLVDNEASRDNVVRFARSQRHQAEVTAVQGGSFAVRISAGRRGKAAPFDPAAFNCTPPARPRLIYVIASDSMGRGSDALGWGLLQTFIQTIRDVQPLPEKILLYNGGVKLVAVDSGALKALQQLQEKGVEILVCGTCLDFFQLQSAIKVGHISNMYDIMNAMASADKLISPY